MVLMVLTAAGRLGADAGRRIGAGRRAQVMVRRMVGQVMVRQVRMRLVRMRLVRRRLLLVRRRLLLLLLVRKWVALDVAEIWME